ncbi:4-hydroxybenzoate 3-monooxygenase [Siccirubricoccus deserti]|uniref:4-hydroxybenzoate 3-monooxygenase n=1 Tax=Siccirubricoccus deserti TaxID=2013562 RepID=A0A9X0QXV0_9PROT|nr:4-hydroxybenzoate 3-monooxygenase [Siccirubricoccus deserti]MBC4015829.1 4-hydroxybenzoate 3-monooxygenase [Siccirubricoccus deserti]GGC44947.1 4-hydroxybenzoate 3-monooxygenase [Siccirubricoccus deserti]
MRTQVGIVGAGPAGLLLAHLLHLAGIESVVLESRSRAYVEERVRAGLLEQGTVDVLTETGVGDRLHREGLPHSGIELRFDGQGHRIDLQGLTGRRVTIYGQQEVVKDLIAARLSHGGPLLFEVADTAVHDADTEHPSISFLHDGQARVLRCDVIAGCDGFHGICRDSIPAGVLRAYERVYPFAWLGILAAARPASHELIYARHERGFALATMRSETLARHYLQCRPDEDIAAWSDDRIWAELHARMARRDGVAQVQEGPILQKGITGMRSFVVEPMRHGRLFLAGDAAHIVPPTGAKGMNLAVADIRVLARALEAFCHGRGSALLDAYSTTALARVWKAQRFSWWMTSMLHRFDGDDGFEHRLQLAELDYVCRSPAASLTLAENYVGLPLSLGASWAA